MDYTTREAAKYLNMNHASFRYYVFNTGRVKSTLRGHTRLFAQEDLDKFFAELRVKIPIPGRDMVNEDGYICILVNPAEYWEDFSLSRLREVLMARAPEGSQLVGFRRTRLAFDTVVGIGKFHLNPVSLFAEWKGQIEIMVNVEPPGRGRL